MKLKSFLAADGVHHPDAVWLPMFISVDHIRKRARAVFCGYHDLATLASGNDALAGAVKEYAVTEPAEYIALVGQPPPPGATLLDSVAAACYELAASRLDTVDPINPTGPMVSFFHGCPDA